MKNQSVPLVGGFYADDTKSWSAQDCVNWLPTQAEKEGTRTPSMLKTPPGLREFVLTPAHPLTLTGHLPSGRLYDTGTYQYNESGGIPPISPLSIVSGSLPTGATMSATGLVTYTYTAAGIFSWTLSGSDATGTVATLPDSLTISSEILATWKSAYIGGNPGPLLVTSVYNGIIVAMSGGTTPYCVYSLNQGTNWTVFTPGTGTNQPTNAIRFNGNWYIFAANATAASCAGDSFAFSAMANAPDGVSASSISTAAILTSSTYPTGALYLGARATTNTSLLRMNTPGAAWTTINTGFAYGAPVSICQAGSVYFVVCNSGKILKSTNLVTFTLAYDTADINLAHSAYLVSAGVFVVTNLSGGYYRTPDLGSTWTFNNTNDIQFITATRQEFLGGRSYTTKKSLDGITWTNVFTNVGYQQFANLSTDGTIAAVGCDNGRVDVGTP